jgi:hypothetical protein
MYGWVRALIHAYVCLGLCTAALETAMAEAARGGPSGPGYAARMFNYFTASLTARIINNLHVRTGTAVQCSVIMYSSPLLSRHACMCLVCDVYVRVTIPNVVSLVLYGPLRGFSA